MLAYFDMFSGISGDMVLGAFVDLGVPVDWLQNQFKKMPLTDAYISVENVWLNGIKAVNLFVDEIVVEQHTTLEDQHHSHLHNCHVSEKHNNTDINNSLQHHRHLHQHNSRNYLQIKELILQSPFSDYVKSSTLKAFEKIAVAESEIHGTPIEEVHFHEVGGVDAIVDITGAFLSVEYLGITKIYASVPSLGTGSVTCSHGVIPVPAPATLKILKGIPVKSSGCNMETITPTGAAIITTMTDQFGDFPKMIIKETGYGAGKIKSQVKGLPNLLRIVLGKNVKLTDSDQIEFNIMHNVLRETVYVIETSIDDMNPEICGYIMDRLFQSGALDVSYSPLFMKKSRPAFKLEIICLKTNLEELIEIVLTESTSSGVRFYLTDRAVLERKKIEIETSFGKIVAKQIKDPKGNNRIIPEYEVCRKIARENSIPIKDVYREINNH